jgi:CDP-paratose 2-epimerase
MGFGLEHGYDERNRIGDHICYISGLSKIRARFPNWRLDYNLEGIVAEIVDENLSRLRSQGVAPAS